MGKLDPDPATEGRAGTVEAVDDATGTIDLKRAATSSAPHPRALIPTGPALDPAAATVFTGPETVVATPGPTRSG